MVWDNLLIELYTSHNCSHTEISFTRLLKCTSEVVRHVTQLKPVGQNAVLSRRAAQVKLGSAGAGLLHFFKWELSELPSSKHLDLFCGKLATDTTAEIERMNQASFGLTANARKPAQKVRDRPAFSSFTRA